MGDLLWLLIVFGYAGLLGALAFGSTRWRHVLWYTSGLALVIPPLIPATQPFVKGFIACAFFVLFLWLRDLTSLKQPLPARTRIRHMMLFPDARRTTIGSARLDWRRLARASSNGALAGMGLLVAYGLPPFTSGAAAWVLRQLGGGLFIFFGFAAICRFSEFGYAASGLLTPTIHGNTLASKSVGDFWGNRWNRIIGDWLRERCYQPLASRQMPRLGLACAFVVSAVLHAYFIWVGLDWLMAGVMATFFLAQGVIVAVERSMAVSSWPVAVQRVWTFGLLLLSSPLFVEPMMRLFDPLFT